MSAKRHLLTLKEKVDVIEVYSKEKLSVRDLSKRFKIGKTQAADIIKKRTELLNMWQSNVNTNMQRRFLRPEGLNIDTLCFDWFTKARSRAIPLSGSLIRAKAKEIAASLGHETFSASSGWLEKFRKRHNITLKTMCGEAASINPDDVETFLSKIPSLVKAYSPRDIFNADEIGLFFCALPNKTMTLKHEKCFGGKLAKERVTILHCVNMAGEKEKLLVIGKAQERRVFKNVTVNNLPLVWKSNEKAWMTSEIMEEWLRDFDERMRSEKRKILLFLDNARSHPKDIQLRNIQVAFIPPNCASVVQPLEQGVIKNFKVFYRAILVKNLLSKIESADTVQGLTKGINLLDAVYFIKQAWEEVTKNTIENCFLKAGITRGDVESIVENKDFSAEDDLSLSVMAELWQNSQAIGLSSTDLEEFLDIDKDLIVEETGNILPGNYEVKSKLMNASDESDEESETINKTNVTNCQETIGVIKDLQPFAEQGDPNDLKEFLNIDKDLIVEETNNILLSNYEVKSEPMDASDQSDEESGTINKSKVTNCQEAIGVIKDLHHFAKHQGDNTAMEMLSNLEIHFQNYIVKTNIR